VVNRPVHQISPSIRTGWQLRVRPRDAANILIRAADGHHRRVLTDQFCPRQGVTKPRWRRRMQRQWRSYGRNKWGGTLIWMQNAQKTRWNSWLHGVRKQWAPFSTPQQRRSGSASNWSGGGTPTSAREEKRSKGTNENDRIQRKPPRQRESSWSQFGCPIAKCEVTTCRTSAEPRCWEQHNMPTLKWVWPWRP